MGESWTEGRRPRGGVVVRGALWSVFYGVLVAAPLVVLGSGLVASRGSGWWFDFSMGLGFAATGVFAGQFLLTARFRRAAAPFGTDVLYVLHRWLAVGGLLIALAHYAILRVGYPSILAPALPGQAPWHMTAGRAALGLFLVLVVSSLWRKAFRIEYDRWRVAHAVLAVTAMGLALAHVLGVGYYSGLFWARLVLDGLLGSLVAIVAYVRVAKPILLTGRPYRVTGVRPEPGRCWAVSLEPVGHRGFDFAPGQFAWLSLGRSPLRAGEHPFSFSGSAERAPALEFTIKELGDFTSGIGRTRLDTVAFVDGPHGVFSVDRYPDSPGFLFVAGGVGIAPVASMLRTLADRGDPRPMGLIYGTRAWEATPLREELARLEAVLDLKVAHVLEEPHEGWTGAAGRPDGALIARMLGELPHGSHCFLCGPEAMNRAVEAALGAEGIPLRRIHTEIFDMA